MQLKMSLLTKFKLCVFVRIITGVWIYDQECRQWFTLIILVTTVADMAWNRKQERKLAEFW